MSELNSGKIKITNDGNIIREVRKIIAEKDKQIEKLKKKLTED